MIRYIRRLIPKKVGSSCFALTSYKQAYLFSDVNPLMESKNADVAKYSLAVNFFNILTQYQIDKMKEGNTPEVQASESEQRLRQYAEEIFTSSNIDPKVIVSMVQNLNQEDILNEQMIRNILSQFPLRTHETLHRFTLDFLITMLKSIEKYDMELSETEEKQLHSLILHHLSINKWDLVKDFLDVFSGRRIAQRLFNNDLELKLIWSLNYAISQIKDFRFFCSFAFSVYSMISNTGDRFNLISEVELIVEEKFNTRAANFDIQDIENLLFFFPHDFLLERQTMDKLASNVLLFNSKITFDSFKKFLQLAATNKHIFSQQPKHQQEKIFEYITDCKNLDELRLFVYPLNQMSLYADPFEAEGEILEVIRRFRGELLTDSAHKEADIILIKYLYKNSQSEVEKEAITKLLETEIQKIDADSSFAYLCSFYSFIARYPIEMELSREKLAVLLNQQFAATAAHEDIPRFAQGIKQMMRNSFRTEFLTDPEKELLTNIEAAIRSEDFSKHVTFDDMKEFLYFANIANKTRLLPLKFLVEFCPPYYTEFDEKIILEEILSLLPFIKKMPFIQAELVPHVIAQAERIVKDKPLDLELLLEVCSNLDHFRAMINTKADVRDATKKFWTACEQHLNKLLIQEKTTSDSVNLFLDSKVPDKKEQKIELYSSFNERELTILLEIFKYLTSWNLGSLGLYDAYQLLFTMYFDKYIESGIPQIAYKLAEINCNKPGFTEKLEAYLLKEQHCGDSLDAFHYAWFFAVKNNYNQELWNVIMNDLNKLESLEGIPIQYLMNLYEILFSVKVEKSYVNISGLSKFIDELDEIWEREHKLGDNKFKRAIRTLLDHECYVVNPDVRAGLYKVDYMYKDVDVVLVLGEDSYLANTKRPFGSVEFRKRLLKQLGFKLHIIERPLYLKEKKTNQKVVYVEGVLKGIPRDVQRWKAIRNMTVTVKKN